MRKDEESRRVEAVEGGERESRGKVEVVERVLILLLNHREESASTFSLIRFWMHFVAFPPSCDIHLGADETQPIIFHKSPGGADWPRAEHFRGHENV